VFLLCEDSLGGLRLSEVDRESGRPPWRRCRARNYGAFEAFISVLVVRSKCPVLLLLLSGVRRSRIRPRL